MDGARVPFTIHHALPLPCALTAASGGRHARCFLNWLKRPMKAPTHTQSSPAAAAAHPALPGPGALTFRAVTA